MRKGFVTILYMLMGLTVLGQFDRKPSTFPIKPEAAATDEIYSQYGNQDVRIPFSAVREFMSPAVVQLSYTPNAMGNTQNLGNLVQNPAGDTYFIAYDGIAYMISSATTVTYVAGQGIAINGNVISTTAGAEVDPTVPEYVKQITEQNISDWNTMPVNTSNFGSILGSGDTTVQVALNTISGTFFDQSNVNELTEYHVTGGPPPSGFKPGDLWWNTATKELYINDNGPIVTIWKQADWNENSATSFAYIKNKPDIAQMISDSLQTVNVTETDPVFAASVAAEITAADTVSWSADDGYIGAAQSHTAGGALNMNFNAVSNASMLVSNSGSYTGTYGPAGATYNSNSANYVFATDPVGQMHFGAGVGTSAANGSVSIYGNSGAPFMQLKNLQKISTQDGTFFERLTTNVELFRNVPMLGSANRLDVGYQSDFNLWWRSAGNVGIGTDPEYGFHLGSSHDDLFIESTLNPTIGLGHSGNTMYNKIWRESGTGIFRIENVQSNDIRFSTNGLERLAVKGDGKIGIGTASPTRKLSVVHDGFAGIWLENSSSGAIIETAVYDDGIGRINLRNDSDLIIRTNNTDHVYINNIGNMGVGASNPLQKLSIGSTADNTIGLRLETDDAIWEQIISTSERFVLRDKTNSFDPFQIYQGAPSNSFIIREDGKVGFGTSAPTTKLDVIGDIGQQFRVSNTAANNAGKYAYHSARHYTNAEEDFVWSAAISLASENKLSIGGGTSLGNAATAIKFFTAANSTTNVGSERMVINNMGNVGINTATPGEALHIYNKKLSLTGDLLANPITAATFNIFGNNSREGIFEINTGFAYRFTDAGGAEYMALNSDAANFGSSSNLPLNRGRVIVRDDVEESGVDYLLTLHKADGTTVFETTTQEGVYHEDQHRVKVVSNKYGNQVSDLLDGREYAAVWNDNSTATYIHIKLDKIVTSSTGFNEVRFALRGSMFGASTAFADREDLTVDGYISLSGGTIVKEKYGANLDSDITITPYIAADNNLTLRISNTAGNVSATYFVMDTGRGYYSGSQGTNTVEVKSIISSNNLTE